MISSTPLFSSLYNSSTYSAHLSITSSFSIKTFPCLLLIVCNPLFPFGRSSLIFWYINCLCALSNISISFHISPQYLSKYHLSSFSNIHLLPYIHQFFHPVVVDQAAFYMHF